MKRAGKSEPIHDDMEPAPVSIGSALGRELAELRARPAERIEVFPREMVEKLRIVASEAEVLTRHLRDLAEMAARMDGAHPPESALRRRAR